MLPITRSQSRDDIHSNFAMFVLEQPTIMDCIIRNLTQSSIEETYHDLCNLKLVFKSRRTLDVIDSYFTQFRKMYMRTKRIEQFTNDLQDIFQNKVENIITEETFIIIMEYIINNLEIMKMSCMQKFRDVVYSKIIDYFSINPEEALKYLNAFSTIYSISIT